MNMQHAAPRSRFFGPEHSRLHYVEWGNVENDAVVLVHGGRDHCRNWDSVAQALCKDWHVIAPDLRGHGDSAWSSDGDYAINTYVYDLAQLVAELDAPTIRLVGHSLGGGIATRYAGLFPEKIERLVAIEGLRPLASGQVTQDAPPLLVRLREWVENKQTFNAHGGRRFQSIDEACERMQEANHHLSGAQARHLTEHGLRKCDDGSYRWKFDRRLRFSMPLDISDAELHEIWSNISCPTLLMYGRDSWASPPNNDGRLNFFQDARVVEYENAGHWLHHDQVERFVEDLIGFLS
ncbi:MAG: alpha/beta hydrolase [Pseudomonadota bacterium]